MPNFDTIDETWTKHGELFRVVRKGNGYEWQIFGKDNFELPVFTGTSGNFYSAREDGVRFMEKDVKEIFRLLNDASVKERKEGEMKDAEVIEMAIRSINAGRKQAALAFLNQIIVKEKHEREPEDVARLEKARTLLLAEKMEKSNDVAV